jgi:hypothetical protein
LIGTPAIAEDGGQRHTGKQDKKAVKHGRILS